ncbi:MAG: methyltransferase domain-containing protein [Chlamydiales bacterium]|nr:methyltransferase domain-containing protein [Chlamydiales bacterium]NCF71570.1 methyltransferase domain-containing protein [Chlamydiales bacterium]
MQTLNAQTEGINLGSGGSWSSPKWVGIDQINGKLLDENSILPFDNESIKYVFSSHFFEHTPYSTLIRLLKESYRVLKKDGVIRIIVPHFALLLRKYLENDETFFKEVIGFKGRQEWSEFKVENTLENILLHWFCNYDSPRYEIVTSEKEMDLDHKDKNGKAKPKVPWPPERYIKGFYRGPPQNIQKQLVNEKARTLSVEEFGDWAVSLVSIEAKEPPCGHVNTLTFDRLADYLEEIGFSKVYLSSHQKSCLPIFNNDNFDKNRRSTHSLYVEAIK